MTYPMDSDLPADHFIVGLGTSAGGLEALERFFTNLPPDTNLAFLIAQHLSPDYKSHMVELLSKYTSLTVVEAADGAYVEAGHIYVLPPRKNMTIFKRKLYLVEYTRGHGVNLPIDIMLDSLAKDQGNNAIACILSGTGSDGTRGIRAIKEHGGMVLAQDDTAKFDGMPRSAISTQLVDFILPAEKMPEVIIRYVTQPTSLGEEVALGKFMTQQDLIGKVLAILRDHIGADFTGYKPNTLIRRIERRMTLFEIDKLEQYIQLLQRNEVERRTLFKEFLIGVTSFFRDSEAFEFIQEEVIPTLMAERTRRQQLRIWVAGCSTGEEAYSLAMLLQDYMERSGRFFDIKIFATDIDPDALEQAGRGEFAESVLADIPEEFLANYFIKQGDLYTIVRQIRSMVVFANHNIIKDPPFSRIDLITCRNLLIYMQPEMQNRILSTFEFSLQPGGYLFLGSSESLGERGNHFVVEQSKWKIYRFRGNHAFFSKPPGDGNTTTQANGKSRLTSFRSSTGAVKSAPDWRNSDQVLRSLVENILPPCIVVDENQNVIHAFGDIDPFVSAPRGYQVNLNISNMVRDPLSIPVTTALHRTFKDSKEVTYNHIQIEEEEKSYLVNIKTGIFWEKGRNQKLAILLFSLEDQLPIPAEEEVFTLSDGINNRLHNLEQELQYTRENLQSTIEELETSNEELQATNEELMAANEELQSTNEELESVNEELLTVNNEYQAKIKELSALNDDMNNLLKSIDIGTLFLDSDLNVRKFTPAAQRYINLLEQDVGRPISHFAHKLSDFDLVEAIHQVLQTLVPAEHEVQNKYNQWLQIRITPYRTFTDQINGVVLTMVDVTDLKSAVDTAEENNEFAQVILNSLSPHIAVMDNSGVIQTVNRAWQKFSEENGGAPHHTDVGANYLEICRAATGFNVEGANECYIGLKALIDGKIDSFDLEYPCHSPDEDRWFLMRAVPLSTAEQGIVISHINVTPQKEIEFELLKSQERLQLATVSRPIALFEHDMTFRYVWTQNTGVPYPMEDAHHQTDHDLLNHIEADRIMGIKRTALKEQRRVQGQVEVTNPAGTNFTCTMIVEPIHDPHGNAIGLIGAFSDFVEVNNT